MSTSLPSSKSEIASAALQPAPMESVRRPGATISFYLQSNKRGGFRSYGSSDSKRSGKNGVYSVHNLEPGEYRITGRINEGDSKSSVETKVFVTEGQTTLCDLIFSSGGVTGITTLLNEPLEKVRINVSVIRDKNNPIQTPKISGSAVSDENGAYEVNNLPPGKYSIRARHRGKKVNYNEYKVLEIGDSVVRCDFRFGDENSCELSGNLYRSSEPISNVSVKCSSKGCDFNQTSDANGYFLFKNLPAGKTTLSFSINAKSEFSYGNRTRITKTLILQEGEASHQDIQLGTGSCFLSGEIIINDQSPKYTYMTVERKTTPGDDIRRYITSTIRTGQYKFENLEAGEYKITIHDPRRFTKDIILYDGQSGVVDFNITSGKARVTGVCKSKKEKEKKTYVYIFKPGQFNYEIGDSIKSISLHHGLIAQQTISTSQSIRIYNLRPETVDVVGLSVKENKIQNLDIRRLTLLQNEKNKVELNVN